MERDNSEALGVYVSVPFCKAKCSFCNFASGVGTPAAMEAYVEKLCAEIAAVGKTAAALGARLPRKVDSVYLGGGTPSLLAPEQLQRIFAGLRAEFVVDKSAEITLEAAPEQIEDDVLDSAMRLGVNRVSLGVQSFVDRESQAVGRTHTEAGCVAEIRRLRTAGLENVGADLIAGLPYQSRESWGYSLEVARRLREEGSLTHLSVYMLEVDEDSRLGREVLAGGLRLHAPRVPAEDVAAELYEMACETLPETGFRQYEISNFAAEGRESRHNRKYWERKPYMGFGLDAASMLRTGSDKDAVRFSNAEELVEYGVREREVTQVGRDEAFEEAVFLGLRLCGGVDAGELREAFGAERLRRCWRAAGELRREGLMELFEGRWRLTLRGRLVSNEVFGRLLEEI